MNPFKSVLRFEVLVALFMVLICLTEADGTTEMVGGDLDCNGCKASAGYTWCEALKICIRPFETECPLFSSFNTTNSSSSFNSQVVTAKMTLKKAPKLVKKSKAPKSSKAPKLVKKSKAPKSSKAPKLVKKSKAPKASKAPKVSKQPKKTKVTKAAKVLDNDGLADTPGYVASTGSTIGRTSTTSGATSYGTYSKTVTVKMSGSSGLTDNLAPSTVVSVTAITLKKTKGKASKAPKLSKEKKLVKASKAPKVLKKIKAPKKTKGIKAANVSDNNSLVNIQPGNVASTGSTTGSTSTTTTTTTTTSNSSSTSSQIVQIVGSSGNCIDAVLKQVDCDTKAAETIFSSSASTCSTTFDFSNKKQFCLTLTVGSFVYNAGPIYSVNTATTSTSSTITITVSSSQVLLQYGTSSKTIMTSSSSGLFFKASGSASVPLVVSPPISAPIAVAPPVTSAPAPGEKKQDLISNDRRG